jgi:hypothetical protein
MSPTNETFKCALYIRNTASLCRLIIFKVRNKVKYFKKRMRCDYISQICGSCALIFGTASNGRKRVVLCTPIIFNSRAQQAGIIFKIRTPHDVYLTDMCGRG